jgi:NADPH:quinone reductase-like Zn-dependent oxidoreductase
MRAYIHTETGRPECLYLADVADPVCGPDDVIVENHAAGLNPVDWKFVEWGHPEWDWPHIPGVDGAGIVRQVGSNVRHLSVGTRVAYHNDLLRPGSFAELTAIPARAAIPLLDGLSFEVAAAIPCPSLTAAQALEKLPENRGGRVLLTGASGAVGGALIQLARRRGWLIHAVASGAQKDRVLGLGASSCIDYHDENWQARLVIGGDSEPYWSVIDMVSGEHASSLAKYVAANGHLVCIQDRQETAPLPPFTTTISLHEVGLNGLHSFGTDAQWAALVAKGRQIAEDCLTGAFDTQLVEVSPFSDLPGALQRLKDGPNPGNRVISIK